MHGDRDLVDVGRLELLACACLPQRFQRRMGAVTSGMKLMLNRFGQKRFAQTLKNSGKVV